MGDFAFARIRLLVAREAIVLILFMAISAMTLNVFMQTRSLEEGSPAFGLSAMLNGTAERPYVYRQLLPTVANFAAGLVPEKDQDAFVKYHLDKYHLKQQYFGRAKHANPGPEFWTPDYAIKFHVVYLIDFLSLLGLAYLLRILVGTVATGPGNSILAVAAPIMFLLLLPLSFLHGNFFYDFPELFFLSGLLLTALKGRYYWWILLLPLAVSNKESNILVPLLYLPVLYAGFRNTNGRGRAGLALSLAIAGALSAALYLYIKSGFVGNPGQTTIWQLQENLAFWTTLQNYFLWHDFYAPLIPFPRGLNLLFVAVLLLLVSISWRSLIRPIQWLFLTSIAISVPLWLFYCHTDEMRNLSFTFIPLFLLCTASLQKIFPTSANLPQR